MGFRRQLIDHQCIERDTDAPDFGPAGSQELVVIAPSMSNPRAAGGEDNSWNQDDIQRGRGDLRRIGNRLFIPPRVLLSRSVEGMHGQRAGGRSPSDIQVRMVEPAQINFVTHGEKRQRALVGIERSLQHIDNLGTGCDMIDSGMLRLGPLPPFGFRPSHMGRVIGPAIVGLMHFISDAGRTVGTIVVGLAITIYSSIVLIWLTQRHASPEKIERAIRLWSRVWLRSAGVELEIRGGEFFDPRQAYVVVSNHRSNLDIPAHFLSVPNPLRFLAKTELFKIPLLGTTMRRIGIVEVDRARGAAIHRELNASAHDNLEHTRSLMVYPEATRSRDGAMRPFKKGAFAIAIENQLPVVPVTTYGSYRAWPPKKLVKGGRVITVIGEPIPTMGLTKADVGDLTSRVRQQIVATFEELESAEGPANPLEHSND